MPDSLSPFLASAVLLTAIPGPAIILIMKSAVLRGRGSAAVTALGVFVGDLVWATMSVVGLTALLIASRPAFEVLRYVGAAYLIYLGIRLIVQRGGAEHGRAPAPVSSSHGRAFVEGLLCELSNPKTLIVFTSVIPPFLPTGSGPAGVAVYGAAFALVGLAMCLAYALVLSAPRRALRPRVSGILMRASGGILTAFGMGLIVEGLREA